MIASGVFFFFSSKRKEFITDSTDMSLHKLQDIMKDREAVYCHPAYLTYMQSTS